MGKERTMQKKYDILFCEYKYHHIILYDLHDFFLFQSEAKDGTQIRVENAKEWNRKIGKRKTYKKGEKKYPKKNQKNLKKRTE